MKQGWEIKKLGEVCKIQTGKLDANAKVDDGVYPFFTCDAKPYRINTYAFDDEAILISGNGSLVGHINYYNGKFNAYQRTYVLTQFTSFHIPFLISYLKGFLRPYIIENKKGGCIPYITLPILQNFAIPCPLREEQERIVEELDCLSGVIEKKREQLKQLDALAQSIFYQMFGDPITNEKGWDVKKVIDVVKMQRGFDLPVQDRDNEGTIPIYGSNGIIGYHTIHKANFGIITGRSGTLGEVYSSNEPFWPLNTTLFSVDTHGNNVIFLKYIMANFHLERFKAGAGVPTLNRNEFHNEPIPNIPLTLQQVFADKIEAIEKQKVLIKKSITQTEDLFNSRMSYYFN